MGQGVQRFLRAQDYGSYAIVAMQIRDRVAQQPGTLGSLLAEGEKHYLVIHLKALLPETPGRLRWAPEER